ncbi:unnamed protein product [Rhizophagus irregularis]|nr:unnamed protein product [Rhizophagus irregularis]
MSQETGKLSQLMPSVKDSLWLWSDIYKKNPKDFFRATQPRDKCFICNNKYPENTTSTVYDCEKCYQMIIEEDFKNWTSGNKELDRVIRQSQLNVKNSNDIFLEVIPFEFGRLLNKIGMGGFSTIYLAYLRISRYSEAFRMNPYWNSRCGRVVLKSFVKSNSNIIANLAKEVF